MPARRAARGRGGCVIGEPSTVWWLRRRGRDPRNVIMDAAFEFGPNWRRPIDELASERCPTLSRFDQIAISAEVAVARDEIEEWIARRRKAVGSSWSGRDNAEAGRWVARRFPWMSARNVHRAVNQSVYYAWQAEWTCSVRICRRSRCGWIATGRVADARRRGALRPQ